MSSSNPAATSGSKSSGSGSSNWFARSASAAAKCAEDDEAPSPGYDVTMGLFPADGLGPPLLCEGVGTFVLALTVGLGSINYDPLFTPFAVGFAYIAMVYAFGPISGGHFNPCISFGLWALKKCNWKRMLCYQSAQVVGATLAGGATQLMALPGGNVAILRPTGSFNLGDAFLVEFFFSVLLIVVIATVSSAKRENSDVDFNQHFGLATGMVVVAAGYATGPITGTTCLNAVVSFSMDWMNGVSPFSTGLVYILAEFFGMLFGCACYRLLRLEDYYADITWSELQEYEPKDGPKMWAEFVGSFYIVLTIGCCLSTGSQATAIAAGAVIMALTYSLHGISGAHLNPAASLAIMVREGMSKKRLKSATECIAYVQIHLVGGVIAAAICQHLQNHGPLAHSNLANVGAANGYDWFSAVGVEIFFTFMFCYVVLIEGTGTPAKSITERCFQRGLAIGITYAAAYLAASRVSGTPLNPAVGVGVAFQTAIAVGSEQAFLACLPLVVAELVAGALAAWAFYITHPWEFSDERPGLDIREERVSKRTEFI